MKSHWKLRATLVVGCCILGLYSGPAALAQDQGRTAPAQIETITVTAERREENLQKVPIAITALTADKLTKMGVLKTDELSFSVPGLVFTHEINGGTPAIRGVGPDSNGTGEEGSVAIYLDDLYLEQGNAAIFQLNSIDSIEVLKGPQGTLFGRNATAGVIQIHTKNPESTPSFDAHVGYANYNTVSGDIYATTALTDNLSANISAFGYDEAQGWGHDVVTGERAFTEKNFGVRSKFLWTPWDDTTVLLTLGHSYSQSEVGLGFNQVPGNFGCCGNGFVGWYNTTDAQNDYAINRHEDIQLRVDHDLGWANVRSISGWQQMNGTAYFNQDGSAFGLVMTALNQFGRDWSEELQLLSPEDSAVKWIGGFFFMHDTSGYNQGRLAGAAFGIPTTKFPHLGSPSLIINSQVSTLSLAGFGQATYEILPGTNLTGGIRYTSDTRDYRGALSLSPVLGGFEITGVPCATGLCPFTADKGFGQWSYRVVVDHHFDDDLMAYFSYNRGFKSGQFDTFGTAAKGPIVNPAVKPEILEAYEVGVKSEFLDHRLQLNAAAYYYEYSNIQFQVIVPGGTGLINAASATIHGGELEFVALPLDHLTLSGGISVIYGHYDSFKNAPDYFIPGCTSAGPILCEIDASGFNMIHSPHLSLNLNADYIVPTEIGNFDLNANYAYTDTFEWRADNSLNQPVVNLFNASVLWSNPSNMWDVRIWGNNLSGAKYYSFGSETLGLGKQFSPAAPRTFGITLGLHL